jgi:biopolymer transport protein ExbD
MDIFTILVFFLMVNSSSEVQVLNQDKSIELPSSSAEQHPKETLILTVSSSEVIVAGRSIVSIAALNEGALEFDPLLREELLYQAGKGQGAIGSDGSDSKPITIIADKHMPYLTLKKIMATCVDAGYTSIALAVNKKPEPSA